MCHKCQRATSSSFPCMVVHTDLFLNFSFSNSKPWNLSIMKLKLCWRILLVCIVTQSYLTLCDPMDCSLLDSPVHGVLLARTLEWVVISYFRGSSWPRDQALFSCISSINRWFFFFLNHFTNWEGLEGSWGHPFCILSPILPPWPWVLLQEKHHCLPMQQSQSFA